MRIIHLPLDSRPVHTQQAALLMGPGETLLQPPAGSLGTLTQSADHEALERTLRQSADALVISIDAWLYGGLVQARESRIKSAQADMGLQHLFQLLKPHGETCGVLNVCLPRLAVTVRDELSLKTWEQQTYAGTIPANPDLEAAMERRLTVVRELAAWTLAHPQWRLAVYQEDCSPGGLQEQLRGPVQNELRPLGERGMFSLGADEQFYESLGVLCNALGRTRPGQLALQVYPQDGLSSTPPFEDQPLAVTLKAKMRYLGLTQQPDAETALLVLSHPEPLDAMAGVARWPDLPRFFIGNKTIWVADLIAANGGHPMLLPGLAQWMHSQQLGSYSGWNTASNGLGITLGAGLWLSGAQDQVKQRWLFWRMLEDLGYQSIVRPKLVDAARRHGWFIWNLGNHLTPAHEELNQELTVWAKANGLPCPDLSLPWQRYFDLGMA